MNPLFFLLGLLGIRAFDFGGSSSSAPVASSGGKGDTNVPIITDKPDTTPGDDDTGDGFAPVAEDDTPPKGDNAGAGDGATDDGGGTGSGTTGGDDGGFTSGGGSTGGETTNDGGDMGGMDDGGMDHGDHGGDDGGMDHGDHGGSTSGGDTDGNSGSDHGHHSTPAIAPPAANASAAEIAAYVNAIRNMPDGHSHSDDAGMANEHMAAMPLVDRSDACHVAVRDGEWDNPNTWHNGVVPGDGARVLIPDGIEVDYDTVSDARLFTVRVDGVLDFATNVDSQMIFDTFIVSPTGHLVIGTENNPVDPDVNIDLIVANNGAINTNWDPMLLSRGLISHGETTIHGAEKDSHEKVSEDPMAGANSVAFDAIPTGWQVGDTIVIAGTSYSGGESNQDEVREITSIEGNRVFFDQPLEHDHASPRADLATSVANYTRNVSIESEDGADSEIFERGHVMFMHSDEVDVRFMEFHELGRTDKSGDSRSVEDLGSTRFDSNVQGRYSLHIHRAGTEDLNDPAILEGNAVFGSPGWGVVHHDSNANLTNNATFDTFGSGFVAETGNETGAWHDNIAIFAQGVQWGSNPKNTSEINAAFDTGRGGEGFWFQGRLIEATDNVAASVNTGYVFFHRDGDSDGMLQLNSEGFAYEDALFGLDSVNPDKPSILGFSGNEAFSAFEGMHVVKATTLQGHDVWTHLDNFTAWSVMRGVNLEYTSHYRLTDFDLIGREEGALDGIHLHNNVSEIVIDGANVSGFQTGIDLHKHFIENHPDTAHQYIVIDANVANNGTPILNYDPRLDVVTTSGQLPNNAPDINLAPMSYSPRSGLNTIEITGTKTDGIGTIEFPGGIENMDIPPWHVAEVVNNYGYYTTSGGQDYMLLDIYFTDRATGTVYYETHPVMLNDINFGTNQNGGDWLNTPFNGVADIVTQNGVTTVDGQVLYQAIEAVPFAGISTQSSEAASAAGTASEVWINGYDEADTLELGVHDGLFANVGEMTNTDLAASGGETILATGGASFEVGASRTLAVFEAAANIGFDGNDGGMAILDFEEGSTVAFAANDGDLGTIEEFDSSAFEGETNVLSGIDLGNATLTIDLAGLSAEAGTAFTLMSADEIVGIFNDAQIGGLGARNATITVDYENDSVSLQLVAGDGAITVETVGEQSNVSSGEDALWEALTAGQGVVMDDHASHDDDEVMAEVA